MTIRYILYIYIYMTIRHTHSVYAWLLNINYIYIYMTIRSIHIHLRYIHIFTMHTYIYDAYIYIQTLRYMVPTYTMVHIICTYMTIRYVPCIYMTIRYTHIYVRYIHTYTDLKVHGPYTYYDTIVCEYMTIRYIACVYITIRCTHIYLRCTHIYLRYTHIRIFTMHAYIYRPWGTWSLHILWYTYYVHTWLLDIYWVAAISSLLQIIGLFCRISSLL